MDPDYWQGRWQRGETGWHRNEVMPLLRRHWPALVPRAGERVLVPLCGKTLDMAWLAAHGQRVLGIELAREAIDAFFGQQRLTPTSSETSSGSLHEAGNVTILEGDAFAVDAPFLADCTLAYDRAALVALPATLRRRYAQTLYARLPSGTRTLLTRWNTRSHSGPDRRSRWMKKRCARCSSRHGTWPCWNAATSFPMNPPGRRAA